MTSDEYLRRVAWQLGDLPWGMRRKLLSELRDHLAELPDGTGLDERLGPPEQYVADLRSAAELGRRRGPIAFVRARRPRNVILTVVVLTLIGLGIGFVVWVDSYQPLATGNTGYGPIGGHYSPAGDGVYVVFHQGKIFRYGTSVWNPGPFTVRVLGVPRLGFPVSYRLLMSAPTTFARGGAAEPFVRFRPFELRPGEERLLVFSGVYREPCRERGPGGAVVSWDAIPIRFTFLWRTTTVDVKLPQSLAFYFPKGTVCRSATP